MMEAITILGLGAMGTRMATRLLDAGHQVTIWNRTAAATEPLAAVGAGVAATPRRAVADADIVIAMVRDDPASQSVWLDPETGALAGLAPGALAIESSTVTHGHALALAYRFTDAGRAFLDAPVLGSRPQAEAGQLVHLIGGAPELVERALPVLRVLGAAQLHAGPAGSGAALKLIANALFGIQVAALAELAAQCTALGLDPAQAFALLGQTAVLSPAAKGAAALIAAGQHAPNFPVALVAKDFDYVLGERAAALPVTAAARAVFGRAIDVGLAGANLTAVASLYPSV